MSKCAAFLIKRISKYDPMANDDAVYGSCNYTIRTFAYLHFFFVSGSKIKCLNYNILKRFILRY